MIPTEDRDRSPRRNPGQQSVLPQRRPPERRNRPVDRHGQISHRGGAAHVTQRLPDVVDRLVSCATVPQANAASNAEITRIPRRNGVTRAAHRGGEHRAARPRRRRGTTTQLRGDRPRSDPPGRQRNVRLGQPDAGWRAHTDGNWAPAGGTVPAVWERSSQTTKVT